MSSPGALGASEDRPVAVYGYGKGWPLVQGACPACGLRSLFLGAAGYVTCGATTCDDPSAPTNLLGDGGTR